MPPIVYLMPVLAIALVIGMLVMQRMRLAQAGQTYAGFVLGTLAPRLGLSLVQGDPSANLMLPPHNTVGTRIADDKPYEWHVRMQGTPRGRPVEVLYFHRRERQSGVLETKYTYYDDAYVGVQLRTQRPEVEVTSNKSSLGPIARRHPLPVQRFGDPVLDGEFTVATQDPALAAKLAPFLTRFDPGLRGYGVHLEVSGGWLRFRADGKHASGVMYFVESIVPLLEQMADRLEQP